MFSSAVLSGHAVANRDRTRNILTQEVVSRQLDAARNDSPSSEVCDEKNRCAGRFSSAMSLLGTAAQREVVGQDGKQTVEVTGDAR